MDGIDLDIAHGEIYALLGPNGAGKTTTVEILEGHRDPDEGSVEVLGGRPGARKHEVGIVLQDTSDAIDLTVSEMVRHFATYYADPWDPRELIGFVGLADSARTRIRQLSGGQRRRLDVALGIVGRPRLLFLDEPTTGFDPQARRRFWTLLKELKDTTILLTTHYLEEAEVLADRVGVLARGRIVAEGSPETLGGRANGLATVSWDGGSQRTDDPVALINRLSRTETLAGLTVTRPSLEDVYLELIGAHQ